MLVFPLQHIHIITTTLKNFPKFPPKQTNHNYFLDELFEFLLDCVKCILNRASTTSMAIMAMAVLLSQQNFLADCTVLH